MMREPSLFCKELLNAIVIQTDTPADVTVIGPGAGRFQAGQGMLADLIAIAKSH
jgi:homoserine dehydrogenase